MTIEVAPAYLGIPICCGRTLCRAFSPRILLDGPDLGLRPRLVYGAPSALLKRLGWVTLSRLANRLVRVTLSALLKRPRELGWELLNTEILALRARMTAMGETVLGERFKRSSGGFGRSALRAVRRLPVGRAESASRRSRWR
jgi:hypothetical protein